MKDSKFEKRNLKNIKSMGNDKDLLNKTKEWIQESWKHEYAYHFSWLGRPIIQFPQDIIAMQEIIWKVKPDVIIETGIARGGSIIFSASILELIGKGNVIGIDIDIREQNKKEIEKHNLFKRITLLQGSSIDKKIVREVSKICKNKKKVMVFLDSNHSHEHVLAELKMYSSMVTKGSYLVVFDTFVEDMPKEVVKDRPWSIGNNPKTAVHEFLKKNNRFKVDYQIENKLLITSCPTGYLKCIKD
jgi:cephalosporin hydroxylase